MKNSLLMVLVVWVFGSVGFAADVTVTPGIQQNTVSWAAGADEKYDLYWSTTAGAGVTGTLVENVTSPYVHTGLERVEYYYTLKARSRVVVNGSYLVIDVSGGSTATSYPWTYSFELPDLTSNNDYKTSKIVLKKIPANPPFYIGVFEMTQAQYLNVTGLSPSYFGGSTRPVEQVSWNDIRGGTYPGGAAAGTFMALLSSKCSGLPLDLPTEAQWEFACRAGTTTEFSYGDIENGDYMWYASNSGGQSHDVATRLPNPWGLYDMHGNIWEWCLDLWGSGSGRVVRGGGWGNSAASCRSANRLGVYPGDLSFDLGFRLCSPTVQ